MTAGPSLQNDLILRDKYISWLKKWIGVDIYGRCGDKQCGEVRNVQHEYSTLTDPCFDLVNRKYRWDRLRYQTVGWSTERG